MVTEGMSVKKMHQTQSKSPKVVCILFIKKTQPEICLLQFGWSPCGIWCIKHICLRKEFLLFQSLYQHWQGQKAAKSCQGEDVKSGIIYKTSEKGLGRE